MLRAAKADAFGAEADCIFRIRRCICIRADSQSPVLVRPVHDALKVAGNGRLDRRNIAEINLAGGTIQGDEISLVDLMSAELEILLFLVHGHISAAGDAAGSHAARDNGSMACHAAAHREDALCGVHAVDILGRGLLTDHDDSLSLRMCSDCIFCIEVNSSCRSSRGCRKRLTDLLCKLKF